jgi:uncharacterized membrane protein SpoIIM required for sporulation
MGSVMSLALLGDSLLYVALPAHAAELALPLWTVGILLGANRIVRLVTNGLAAGLFARVGARGRSSRPASAPSSRRRCTV